MAIVQQTAETADIEKN